MDKKIIIDLNGGDVLFTSLLTAMIGPMAGKTMIDLCCNNAPFTSRFPFADKCYVDIEPREIPEQHRFVQADVLGDHPKLLEHYDVALCLDGIEHIIKADGFKLVERMKKMSNKAILFTPLDPWMLEAEGSEKYLNDPKSHKCVWSPEDLPDWAHIVLPVYHPTLGIGAFFSWYCENLDQDFQRVRAELKR